MSPKLADSVAVLSRVFWTSSKAALISRTIITTPVSFCRSRVFWTSLRAALKSRTIFPTSVSFLGSVYRSR
ncbi:Protein of unknown function [Cotesia congregata]|uniref:Uncharacterized protein n=1 Tax=Cotesia congregata TaxID=51543 RepID=A0A8J2H5J0_COTCN|nr:Protein of unknown function [Cotesia congregata]